MRIPETEERMLAIHIACLNNRLEIVKLFFENRVPPNVLNNKIDKATPLHYSILSRNPELVKYILRKKGDPNFRDVQGNTPYHFACMIGNLEIIQLLEEYKGDALCKNNSGASPLDIIVKSKNKEIMGYFMGIKKYANELI